jgi:hypothetical protein
MSALAAVLLLALAAASPAAAQTRAPIVTQELAASRDETSGLDVSSVGYIEVDTGARQNFGTASLIDACHVKTAAHMFRSRDRGAVNTAANAKVSFGYRREGEQFSFESAHRLVDVRLNPQFDPARTQQPRHDVAIARIEPCVKDAAIATDRTSGIDEIGKMSRRFAVVGFVPDKDLRPRLFAQRSCLWTGDGDALGILLNCAGKAGMSGGSVFMAEGGGLVDVGVFTSSVNVNGRTYGAFSPLSASRSILP